MQHIDLRNIKINQIQIFLYDRISVVRYNRNYILPALDEAGKTYAETLETGFDMYY